MGEHLKPLSADGTTVASPCPVDVTQSLTRVGAEHRPIFRLVLLDGRCLADRLDLGDQFGVELRRGAGVVAAGGVLHALFVREDAVVGRRVITRVRRGRGGGLGRTGIRSGRRRSGRGVDALVDAADEHEEHDDGGQPPGDGREHLDAVHGVLLG